MKTITTICILIIVLAGYLFITDRQAFNNDYERQVAFYTESMQRECKGDSYEHCMEFYSEIISEINDRAYSNK